MASAELQSHYIRIEILKSFVEVFRFFALQSHYIRIEIYLVEV